MRCRFTAVIMAVLTLLSPIAALGQTYPGRLVKLLVPFPAGRSTDQVARLLGNELQKAFGSAIRGRQQAGCAGIARG
jgi:tripartite-type tricarboxylate transporter receptor subunit TctC